ncbi:MAG: restriction endonuclease subunit S, partial [Candidatus Saccharimonadales bacterium]
ALERVKASLKRYRASVLKAAVEGRLTESWRAKNPPKETGEQLLTRILKKRRRKWEEDQLAAFAAAGKQPPKNWRARYQQPVAPGSIGLLGLPATWCWATVRQIGDVQLGRQRSPKNRSLRFPTKYIRAANLTEAGLDLTDVLDMEFQPRELETYRLHPGDILLSEASGSPDQVGKPVVWNGEIDDCCFQNTVIRLRSPQLSSGYLLTVFRHYYRSRLFARVSTGVGINHLSAARFAALPVPIPPLAEQREIAAEVEKRLSVIAIAEKQLEINRIRAARLRQSILSRAFAGELVAQDPADEPAAALLARIQQSQAATATVRTKGKQPSDEFLRRAAIVSYTVKRLSPRPSFGRTQLEKTLHLAQSHLGIDLGLQFERYAAGPFDKSIYRLEATAKKSGWFTKQERRRFGVTYHPGPRIDAMCQQAARLLGDKQADFDRLLDHMAAMNTDEAELFATAYAAWNDLL